MTPNSPSKRQLLQGLFALGLAATGLPGCGGRREDDVVGTRVRLVNATAALASADLYRGDERIAAGIAIDAAGGYADVDDGTATYKLTANGQTVGLGEVSPALENDTAYTALAWGRAGAVNLTMLTDDEGEPDDGYGKVRFFGAATDAPALDVYLTDATTVLDDTSPVAQLTETGKASAYSQIGTGIYRLRVTAGGDATDLRLDVPDFVVAGDERITLVLQPSSGGVLVHALKVVQRGAVTAYRNTSARVRLVASVAAQGRIGLAIGGTTLVAGLSSPGLGTYQLVAAGTVTPVITVNSVALGTAPQTLVAGNDHTLLVYGSAAAPALALLVDDNRLPTISGRARMRIVNGLAAEPSLTLTLDAVTVASAIAPGNASAPQQVQSNAESVLEVYGAAADPIYSSEANPVTIADARVYTVFMLDGAATPVQRLSRDR